MAHDATVGLVRSQQFAQGGPAKRWKDEGEIPSNKAIKKFNVEVILMFVAYVNIAGFRPIFQLVTHKLSQVMIAGELKPGRVEGPSGRQPRVHNYSCRWDFYAKSGVPKIGNLHSLQSLTISCVEIMGANDGKALKS